MMTVALPSELEDLVNAKIQSGQYQSAGEVIREGLRLLEEKDILRQIKLDQLRKDIAIGIEQADRGDLAPLDVEDIIARGKQRLAEAKAQNG
jgi:antitoxin ParD1/3/4